MFVLSSVVIVHLMSVEQCKVAAEPRTKSADMAESTCIVCCESTCIVCCLVSPSLSCITQPKRRCSFYHPMKGRRLS